MDPAFNSCKNHTQWIVALNMETGQSDLGQYDSLYESLVRFPIQETVNPCKTQVQMSTVTYS